MVQAGRADGVLEAEQVSGTGRGEGHGGQSVHTHTPQPAVLHARLSCELVTANTATAACAMLQFPKCQQEHMWKDVSNRCLSKGLRSHGSEREQGDTVSFIRATQQKKKIIHPCITLIAKLRPTLFNLLEMKRMFCSAYTLRLFDELLSNSAFNYHSHRPSGRHFCLRVWLFDVISNFL